MFQYSIIVAGGATEAVNGVYSESPTLDRNGEPYWILDTGGQPYYIYSEPISGHWVIGQTLNGGPAMVDGIPSTIVYSANGTATNGPETATGWVTSFDPYGWTGLAPAPTLRRAGINRLYSTGVLTLTLPGTTPVPGGTLVQGGTSVTFATVQEAEVSLAYQDQLVYGPAQVSLYPQAVGFHSATWTVRITLAEFSSAALQLLAAAKLDDGDAEFAEQVMIGGNNLPMPQLSGEFDAETSDGLIYRWQFPALYGKGISLPFKLNDFMMPPFEMTAIDNGSGTVASLVAQN